MAGKAVKSVAKAVGKYQYPWREKLAKHKDELVKGVWGYWELGDGSHSASAPATELVSAKKIAAQKAGPYCGTDGEDASNVGGLQEEKVAEEDEGRGGCQGRRLGSVLRFPSSDFLRGELCFVW
ncbi:hypothetical protein Acr_21g0010710 [Actinidia rufa]|uniref:Uncharacterized protein n=1 Tax=Actinidia rufa TaxID=165716 RepID=A0A7J0GIA3_9ERIC|nr:hypothetical protein Acr_21g0010710 [Actinidia rufa]